MQCSSRGQKRGQKIDPSIIAENFLLLRERMSPETRHAVSMACHSAGPWAGSQISVRESVSVR